MHIGMLIPAIVTGWFFCRIFRKLPAVNFPMSRFTALVTITIEPLLVSFAVPGHLTISFLLLGGTLQSSVDIFLAQITNTCKCIQNSFGILITTLWVLIPFFPPFWCHIFLIAISRWLGIRLNPWFSATKFSVECNPGLLLYSLLIDMHHSSKNH